MRCTALAALLVLLFSLSGCVGNGQVSREALMQETQLVAADLRGASTIIEDPALREALLVAARVLEEFDGDLGDARSALSLVRTLAEEYLHGGDRTTALAAILIAESALRRWEAHQSVP